MKRVYEIELIAINTIYATNQINSHSITCSSDGTVWIVCKISQTRNNSQVEKVKYACDFSNYISLT